MKWADWKKTVSRMHQTCACGHSLATHKPIGEGFPFSCVGTWRVVGGYEICGCSTFRKALEQKGRPGTF